MKKRAWQLAAIEIHIHAAIEELGGTLTPVQQVKLRKATSAADTFRRDA